jgi:hypothetical protein
MIEIDVIDFCPELRVGSIQRANFECLDCHYGKYFRWFKLIDFVLLVVVKSDKN